MTVHLEEKISTRSDNTVFDSLIVSSDGTSLTFLFKNGMDSMAEYKVHNFRGKDLDSGDTLTLKFGGV